MARGRRDGLLIAGGGLAGCLAALALARHRPDVPLLIVEEDTKFGGDGLWWALADELGEEERALIEPLVEYRWPGYYLAFPGANRKIRSDILAFSAAQLQIAVATALKTDQYRLGTRAVAVREDALVLDGGETIKADGAIDARGVQRVEQTGEVGPEVADRVVGDGTRQMDDVADVAALPEVEEGVPVGGVERLHSDLAVEERRDLGPPVGGHDDLVPEIDECACGVGAAHAQPSGDQDHRGSTS
jgi:NADPH-dependent 2,4-dienoyl-CoA reductase/sulfur reductase-like enzyme